MTVFSLIFILLGFVFSGVAGAVAYFLPVLIAGMQQVGQRADIAVAAAGTPSSSTPTPRPTAAVAGAPFTVLLLGSDNDSKFKSEQVLTQSMILVRVDPVAKRVTMLSIPRDLWVPLSVGGTAKIDAAYAYGGPKAAIATVERNFHVHIDDYAWVGLKGLIKIIDMVGGVNLIATKPVLDDFYPNDIDSNNHDGYTRVAVLPGAQHLDGAHALEYVRSRHSDLQADFGRSARQQQVLLALRSKTNYLNPADLPDLVGALKGEFKTSMSIGRIRDLLQVGRYIDLATIHQILLPSPYTTGQLIDNQEVLVPRWNLILPLVRENFP
jgi:LCP family protein required for cell wall assembly